MGNNNLQLAHEVQCQVGKYYSVAHAILQTAYEIFLEVPIIPIFHSDKQFGVDFQHYHIDGRFGMSSRVRFLYNVKNGTTNHIVVNSEDVEIVEIVYKRKRCLRVIGGIHPPFHKTEFKDSKYAVWYTSMIGKSCKGKKCPHLGALMVDNGTDLVCPLHDLHGCRETETIVKHPKSI